MSPSDEARLDGLRRWEEWLLARLRPEGVVREPSAGEQSDGVWRVGFQDGTRARIYVTDEALRVSEAEFWSTVDALEQVDWIAMLKAARPGGIRIHAGGGFDTVDPEA